MLTDYEKSDAELLDALLYNHAVTPTGGGVSMRTALVRHSQETTYVVPGDWPAADGNDWFHNGAMIPGSDPDYLIDGERTFDAMLEAMEKATKKGHFIVLLGWSLDVNFTFSGKKTFLQVARERSKLGVAVRVLLFDNSEYRINETSKARLNALAAAEQLDIACNLDDNTKGTVTGPVAKVAGRSGIHSYGAHHHKIVVVFGDEGLVGFCGGIDLDANRINPRYRLHDVHVRVVGDAAKELLKIAEQRWESAKDDDKPPSPPSIKPLTGQTFAPPTSARYLASVVQTIGNPDITGVSSNLWTGIQHALLRAKRFVYIEDQYFWSLDLVQAIVDASKHVKHITILVPDAVVGERFYMRHRALAELVRLGGKGIEKRVGIFSKKRGPHEWVHAKMFVIDDEYALIGSANANNRGYFLDSEAQVGVAERAWKSKEGARGGGWFVVRSNFARRLRIELWAEHLGMKTEELFDGVGSRIHWEALPSTANVASYESIDVKQFEKDLDLLEKQGKARKSNSYLYSGLSPVLPPTTRRPWWDAPYEEWDSGMHKDQSVVDPKL
jgi:phosphatidylserine/phosphatidylglycerophosphate/cardiolipin synthase-like enzyme